MRTTVAVLQDRHQQVHLGALLEIWLMFPLLEFMQLLNQQLEICEAAVWHLTVLVEERPATIVAKVRTLREVQELSAR